VEGVDEDFGAVEPTGVELSQDANSVAAERKMNDDRRVKKCMNESSVTNVEWAIIGAKTMPSAGSLC
jgi:hypothetical protein